MSDPNLSGTVSPKRHNAAAVMGFAWGTDAFTATDAMNATGLTRTTVIALCDELVRLGWLVELADARAAGEYTKGRPARRYELNASAGYVLGVDASARAIVASVSDLRGREVSRETHRLTRSGISEETRSKEVDAVVVRVLESAHVAREHVLCLVVGVPAPTDSAGNAPRGQGYRQRMNPGYAPHFAPLFRHVIVENDAILGAIGEGRCGEGQGVSSYVTFLLREGIGAGFMVDGRPIRGFHGAAGELWMLGLIRGVGVRGIELMIAQCAIGNYDMNVIDSERGLTLAAANAGVADANEAVADANEGVADASAGVTDASEVVDRVTTQGSALTGLHYSEITAERVIAAAEAGDEFAEQVLEDTASHLAGICEAVGGMLDVERLIFSGTSLPIAGIVRRTSELVAAEWHPDFSAPPAVLSSLGDDVVVLGSVIHGLEWVHRNLFDLAGEEAPGVDAE